jgi:transposase InsO family protein
MSDDGNGSLRRLPFRQRHQIKQGLARYLDFYNTRRPHTALGKQTPDTAYFDQIHLQAA